MKTNRNVGRIAGGLIALLLLFLQMGCGRRQHGSVWKEGPIRLAEATAFPTSAPDPLRIVLAPIESKTPLDAKIAEAQRHVRSGINGEAALEHLGWLFVHKARFSFDSGYYKLAEQCALGLNAKHPGSVEAMLLRGHVLQNLHRFKQAEPLARELTRRRTFSADFGLLGDVLMEQGQLEEAVAAYQRMADLKPDMQAMARAAHMRWLKGDLEGAIEMMRMAAQAASPRDAESAAWVHSRMAIYLLQTGDIAGAKRYCDAALDFQPDYAPALLAKGRLFLALDKASDALEPLSQAAAANPLPEYLWALSEALQAAGKTEEAFKVKLQLRVRGAATDPRTFSLYLSTQGEQPETAARLANEELQSRQDIFTWDALAWSLAAQGYWLEASQRMDRALAEGTKDARLFLHAAVIAAETGNENQKKKFMGQAKAVQQMLLPSERSLLAKYLEKDRQPTQIRTLTSAAIDSQGILEKDQQQQNERQE